MWKSRTYIQSRGTLTDPSSARGETKTQKKKVQRLFFCSISSAAVDNEILKAATARGRGATAAATRRGGAVVARRGGAVATDSTSGKANAAGMVSTAVTQMRKGVRQLRQTRGVRVAQVNLLRRPPSQLCHRRCSTAPAACTTAAAPSSVALLGIADVSAIGV